MIMEVLPTSITIQIAPYLSPPTVDYLTAPTRFKKPKVQRQVQSKADADHHLEKARLKRQRRIERNKRLAEKRKQV